MLIVGADPEGSVYTAEDEGDLHPYLVEGIGKDTWPKTMDPRRRRRVGARLRPRLVPHRAAARARGGAARRRLRRLDGLGRARGREAARRRRRAILTMIPDSGRSYMSKFYDDNWMLEHGFLERRAPAPTVEEVLRSKRVEEADVPELVTISAHQKVGEAIDLMQRYSISQLAVVRDGEVDSLADVDRLAPGPRPARRACSRTRTRCTRTSPTRCSRRSRPSTSSDSLDEVFATLTGRTNAVVVARPAGRSACSRAPTCSSTSRTTADAAR